MKFHIAAFIAGFIADLILGDPYWMPHPVRLLGNLISYLEKKWNTSYQKEAESLRAGKKMVVVVLTVTFLGTLALLTLAYAIHPLAGAIVESIMTYQMLATKCLRVESMKVYKALGTGDIEASRKAVSMIVGRDTKQLDETQVAKAAIETVAENTSDGIIAPMLCACIGGPVLMFLYKAVNTMDSMVGYKNDRYLYFGRAAAKLDDVMNYLPARISAVCMVLSAGILEIFSAKYYSIKNAWKIFKRDRYKHASPNSAQTEAVCAGALSIQLAGDASYFGKVLKKPFIGDAVRPVEREDIRRANQLMYTTAILCELLCCVCLLVAAWLF